MDVRPVCCDPCEVRELCDAHRNCCLSCHFSYEEELVLPFLPVPLRARLVEEHRRIAAMGYPEDAMKAHARWEEQVFVAYEVPEAVRKQISDDHEAHTAGQLVDFQSVPLPRRMNPDPGILKVRRVNAAIRYLS